MAPHESTSVPHGQVWTPTAAGTFRSPGTLPSQAHARKSSTPGPGKYRTDMDLPMQKMQGTDWVARGFCSSSEPQKTFSTVFVILAVPVSFMAFWYFSVYLR